MPKTYNINEIVLLDTQRMINHRLKKGDFITVDGGEALTQVEGILKKNNLAYVVNDYAFGVKLVTIN